MSKHYSILLALTVGACAPAVSKVQDSQGFFGGVAIAPFTNAIEIGGVYRTDPGKRLTPAVPIRKLCDKDTATIDKTVNVALVSNEKGEQSKSFSAGLDKLPVVAAIVGAKGEYGDTAKWEFSGPNGVQVEQFVEGRLPQKVGSVKDLIFPNCRNRVAYWKRQGSDVFVVTSAYRPDKAHVEFGTMTTAGVNVGIAPFGGKFSGNYKSLGTRDGTQLYVEIVPDLF